MTAFYSTFWRNAISVTFTGRTFGQNKDKISHISIILPWPFFLFLEQKHHNRAAIGGLTGFYGQSSFQKWVFSPLISQFFLQDGQLRTRDVTISHALRHISSLIAPTDPFYLQGSEKSWIERIVPEKSESFLMFVWILSVNSEISGWIRGTSLKPAVVLKGKHLFYTYQRLPSSPWTHEVENTKNKTLQHGANKYK